MHLFFVAHLIRVPYLFIFIRLSIFVHLVTLSYLLVFIRPSSLHMYKYISKDRTRGRKPFLSLYNRQVEGGDSECCVGWGWDDAEIGRPSSETLFASEKRTV